jgi:hypothetical protein
MLGKIGMAAMFVLATAAPALAGTCSEPIPPEITVRGATATEQQMNDAIKDFKTYQAASDDYQACLVADLKAQKEAAAKAKDPKPLDPAIAAGVNAKITANQAEKEKVGGELNAQINAYKQAHPNG